MEECEALCHRLGIMVGGRLRCLGSTTHLKRTYGNGYQLDVLVDESMIEAFKGVLTQTWPTVKIIEQHGRNIKFRLPREQEGRMTTIGSVFRYMEGTKQQFNIHDYSVQETSLEQIFLGFAKLQEEETGVPAGLE
jgi:ABC-type multidrug transport system ATPase subunit